MGMFVDADEYKNPRCLEDTKWRKVLVEKNSFASDMFQKKMD